MLSQQSRDLAWVVPEHDDMLARLERTIRSRTGGHVRDLHVEFTDGGIILSGTASTYYAKQLATHAALDELTGHAVHNAIDVI